MHAGKHRPSKILALLAALLVASISTASQPNPSPNNLPVFTGFLTKLTCQGRILASSIGNDQLVQLEPLPQAIGCGVVLKPVQKTGSTNLIIETSAGTIHRTITVCDPQGRVPKDSELLIEVRPTP